MQAVYYRDQSDNESVKEYPAAPFGRGGAGGGAADSARSRRAQREETIGVMLGLGYNYLDGAIIDQLLKEPTVANALEQLVLDSLIRGKAEGRKKGKPKGGKKGKRRGSVRRLLTVLCRAVRRCS